MAGKILAGTSLTPTLVFYSPPSGPYVNFGQMMSAFEWTNHMKTICHENCRDQIAGWSEATMRQWLGIVKSSLPLRALGCNMWRGFWDFMFWAFFHCLIPVARFMIFWFYTDSARRDKYGDRHVNWVRLQATVAGLTDPQCRFPKLDQRHFCAFMTWFPSGTSRVISEIPCSNTHQIFTRICQVVCVADEGVLVTLLNQPGCGQPGDRPVCQHVPGRIPKDQWHSLVFVRILRELDLGRL